MGTRTSLSDCLHSIQAVNDHVYFQPPEGFKMVYPCIVYELENDDALNADNLIYRRKKKYTITVISGDPDTTIPDAVGDLFQIKMDRHFKSDNLHHYVYSIVY